MIIKVRSDPENWMKESTGIKPCTVRALDGHDTIEITNTNTNFVHTAIITDITTYQGRVIISFSNREEMKE